MRWIPIEERLPESDAAILVTIAANRYDYAKVKIAHYYDHLHNFYDGDECLVNVRAWKPIYPYRGPRPAGDTFAHMAEMYIECQLNESCEDCIYKKECTERTDTEIEGPNRQMAYMLADVLDKADKLGVLTANEFEELLT